MGVVENLQVECSEPFEELRHHPFDFLGPGLGDDANCSDHGVPISLRCGRILLRSPPGVEEKLQVSLSARQAARPHCLDEEARLHCSGLHPLDGALV